MFIEDLVRSERIRKIKKILMETHEKRTSIQQIVKHQMLALHIKSILFNEFDGLGGHFNSALSNVDKQ